MDIEIRTERLLLRPIQTSDWETVHEYASDLENTRFMIFLPNETVEETQEFLRSAVAEWQKETPGTYEFAIVLDGRQIGAVSLMLNEDRTEAEMGWILNKRYWRRGYMTEAALAARDFAIRELKATRLYAACDARNEASWRVMERLGFRLEKEYGGREYPKTGEIARERLYTLIVSD